MFIVMSIPDMDKSEISSRTEHVAVVGLGLLGRGIAACFVEHGFEVVAIGRSKRRQSEARAQVQQMVGELIDLAGFDDRLRHDWSARYVPTSDFAALRGCSFVVESVVEDMAVKQGIYDSIEAQVGSETVIASNSSAIPISELQSRRRHPLRFVGMDMVSSITRLRRRVGGKNCIAATRGGLRNCKTNTFPANKRSRAKYVINGSTQVLLSY